ncbi:hypothetical protein N0V90_009055 [Kalmusia sp. IMI 367209]|nr:hypothetical protein N0V90_009055 [Kalmusia sp. IMI 367209]
MEDVTEKLGRVVNPAAILNASEVFDILQDEYTPPFADDFDLFKPNGSQDDAVIINVELHVSVDALHGFGVDTVGLPVSGWTESCEAWMRQMGFLE